MAKHRIRRWFQFGILDLLILMTIVAVMTVLYRPPQKPTNRPFVIFNDHSFIDRGPLMELIDDAGSQVQRK